MWISSTWPSATCSELDGARVAVARRRGRRPAAAHPARRAALAAALRGRQAAARVPLRPAGLLGALAALAAALCAPPAAARVFATQEEALARVMPPPIRIERRTAYLTDAQARRVEDLSGEPLEYRVVPYYVGTRDGRIVGYAFADSHLVRTLPESVLFALDPDGRIRTTEILSFDEPQDYLPGPRWLEQLDRRRLDGGLSLKRDIRTLAGATLSARALTGAARRVLALYEVIVREADAPAGEGRP